MPPAIIAAGIGAAGSIGGALIGSSGAKSAANTENQAAQQIAQMARNDAQTGIGYIQSGAQQGIDYLKEGAANATDALGSYYDEAKGYLTPYLQTGNAAMSQLAGLYGLPGYTAIDPTTTLENTPGYQFTLNQGVQALDRSAASRGTVLSGGQRKDITEYGQQAALANAWAPYVQQLNTMAASGQAGATNLAGLANQTGQQVGNWLYGVGTGSSALTAAAGNNAANILMGADQTAASALGGAASNAAQAQLASSGYLANGLTSALGSFGGTPQLANWASSLFGGGGGGSSGYAAAQDLPTYGVSDARVKTAVRRVGMTDEGLPVYTFRYRGDRSGSTHMGVMAQDVARIRPRAVAQRSDGLMAVDYSQLGRPSFHRSRGSLISSSLRA